MSWPTENNGFAFDQRYTARIQELSTENNNLRQESSKIQAGIVATVKALEAERDAARAEVDRAREETLGVKRQKSMLEQQLEAAGVAAAATTEKLQAHAAQKKESEEIKKKLETELAVQRLRADTLAREAATAKASADALTVLAQQTKARATRWGNEIRSAFKRFKVRGKAANARCLTPHSGIRRGRVCAQGERRVRHFAGDGVERFSPDSCRHAGGACQSQGGRTVAHRRC
jgi:predicted  nucleic acid-binding Zn-ribbon protein